MQISALEDEFELARGMPQLLYVKAPAPDREPLLADLLGRIARQVSYRRFATPAELGRLVRDDLAVLLSERFTASPAARDAPVADRRRRRPADALWLPRSGVRRVYARAGSCALQGRSSCQMMPAPRKSRPRSPDESGPPWSPATLMPSGICWTTVPAGVRQRVPATPTAATATRSPPGGPAHEPPAHERWSLR
jgi:hypothetical protein